MMTRTILLASAAAVATFATPALAQSDAATQSPAAEDAPNGSDIVVTGSRIRRQDLAGVGPATVVSAEQIENTGVVNIETVLQRLPANAGFAGNQTSAYWANNGYGTAQVNLRGLGIKRTLVLLNGRRLVAGGTGANSSPDLNMIPVAALARTDVLKDGASAIYGADAMAGVVNLVTRTDYEGLGLSVRQGITEKGDGSDFTADLLWGVRNDRGGFMAAVTYQKTSAVNMATRAPCSLAETTPGMLSCVNSASTIGGRAVLPNGQQINFNQVLGGTFLSAQPINTGREEMNGLDLGLVYNNDIGSVNVSLDVNVTYLNKYVVLPFPGGAPIDFDGFIGGGNGGYPKWRGYGVLTAEKDGVSATWSTQWIGKATDFNAAPGDIGYSTPNVFYHNLQVAFEIDEKTRFQVGVDNLFDRKAPYIQSFTDANTDTMTYDLLGRRFYVGFRTAF